MHNVSNGIAVDRLAALEPFLDAYVSSGRLPGCACLVSRHGKEACFTSIGMRDVERKLPIERDTVFRIYSMTKPITSVALMTLYERGAFALDDPVARYIPQWQKLKVFASGNENDFRVTEPARAMRIKDLFTHTSGLTYGFMQSHPVDGMYRAQDIGGMATSGTLEEMIGKLADIPLQFSPGARWNYGVSTDVLGYLVQKLADMPLDEFVRTRITDPLAMKDSGFKVRPDQAARFAACYERIPNTDAYRLQDDATRSAYLSQPSFLSGGGGMVSTIDDYHNFTRMLLGKGEYGGSRILGRKTLEYMTLNHMPDNKDLAAMGQPVFSETPYDGVGFGLGFSVVIDPAKSNVIDSVGEYAWGGAASTYFWVDPAESLVVIFMTQLIPSSSYPLRRQLKQIVYQTLID
ncbi:MAG: beta-lactamase family protein [Gammaproteobacteria bacterium]|nr:beta-lactamase family protein [Gammaproteobacteria bacterium]